jgi:hypothetical protein
MWFRIKMDNSCTDGARHIFEMFYSARYLRPELQDVVKNVIQTNAFFAHCENVLLAMLVDKRVEVRERSVQLILNARQRHESSQGKY